MRRERLADRAYEHVKNLLLDRLVGEDQRFSIDEIAGTPAMSRQPMMVAIKRHTQDGFVEMCHRPVAA